MDNQVPPQLLVPRLQILSETEILALHDASLDILSQTGVAMKNVAARELLLASGASEADGRIKIPLMWSPTRLLPRPRAFPCTTGLAS